MYDNDQDCDDIAQPEDTIAQTKYRRRCMVCGWVLREAKYICDHYDNGSCYRRRVHPYKINMTKMPVGSADYNIYSCQICRLRPTYRDACIMHLFSEDPSQLTDRWGITAAALYAVKKRRLANIELARQKHRNLQAKLKLKGVACTCQKKSAIS